MLDLVVLQARERDADIWGEKEREQQKTCPATVFTFGLSCFKLGLNDFLFLLLHFLCQTRAEVRKMPIATTTVNLPTTGQKNGQMNIG